MKGKLSNFPFLVVALAIAVDRQLGHWVWGVGVQGQHPLQTYEAMAIFHLKGSQNLETFLEAIADTSLEAHGIRRAVFVGIDAPLGIAVDHDVFAHACFSARRQHHRVFVA